MFTQFASFVMALTASLLDTKLMPGGNQGEERQWNQNTFDLDQIKVKYLFLNSSPKSTNKLLVTTF